MIGFTVALAGGLGALARFVCDGLVRDRIGTAFPYGTLAVNLAGSLLFGLLTGAVLFHGAPARLTTIAGVGFCGGFTTFSTASFESVRLLQVRAYAKALANTAGSLAACLAAAALGLVISRL